MTEKEILAEETADVTPAPAHVHIETIEVQEGSWEEYVGAVGEAQVIYRRSSLHESGHQPKPLGIVFFSGGNWCIAATGHEAYAFPGGQASSIMHKDAIWWLDKCHIIVTNDSPKTTWRPA